MRPFLTLHHPACARHYYAEGTWRNDTFYSLLADHAKARPDAAALRDGGRRLTWCEVTAWVDGVAADLHRHGLVGGDRVSIWMSNKLEAIITFLACSREGFACNPSLHRTYTCAEVVQLLDNLQAKAFLTEHGWGLTAPTSISTPCSLKSARCAKCTVATHFRRPARRSPSRSRIPTK